MPRSQLVLETTFEAAVPESEGQEIPLGFDLVGVQYRIECADFDGQTVTPRLEGSNAPGETAPTDAADWLTVEGATPTAIGASGSVIVGGDQQVVILGQWRWIRLAGVVSGPTAVEGTIAAWITAVGSAGY
jgi:hypothetical protein